MEDYELFKETGINFPKDFVFTKEDLKDFYVALSQFKYRTLMRHGIDPKDIIAHIERRILNKRTERGG